jgi:hypothetical protein
MKEIDGLILILIDFYIPALTSRFHWCKTALQLPDNTTQFSLWSFVYINVSAAKTVIWTARILSCHLNTNYRGISMGRHRPSSYWSALSTSSSWHQALCSTLCDDTCMYVTDHKEGCVLSCNEVSFQCSCRVSTGKVRISPRVAK